MRTQTAAFFLAVLACGCGAIDPTAGETPLSIIKDEKGFGRPAESGDTVTISYRTLLTDGREILSDDHYRFTLGAGSVIAAVDEAVTGMRARGKRIIESPPDKHWGREGFGDGAIPPHTNLIFHIELLEIERP